ncbi:MAG: S8 family serine peptidase [Candidatus Daviesbacteria bacterium]|nr:S8 family serine peptidase [Candidatus Daviesbacteria bacterium]
MSNQKGLAPVILILLASVGVIAYLIISQTFPFNNGVFNFLYPKPSSKAQGVESIADEILIKFKAGVPDKAKDNVKNEHGLSKLDEIEQLGVERFKVPEDKKGKVLEALNKNPRVEFAEPNYIITAQEVPNDPEYTANRQWAVNKIGLPAAYDISKGSSTTIVAVLDTGIAPHPDLEGKILPRFNFLTNTTDVAGTSGHSNNVSGIIGALTNNGVGIASVCPLCPILPLKVLDDSTLSGSYYNVAQAVIYATDHRAKVINMSLGGSGSDFTLKNAITYAWNKGLILAASAGNYNTSPILYPAAEPVVIAVGATDQNDNRWSGSNYGEGLDMMAPGVGVRSTTATGTYAYVSGTSFASPFVAGLAGLIMSANPDLTNQQVVDIITSTTLDMQDAGWDQYTGYGRIQADKALQKATGSTAPPPDTTAPTVSITAPSSGSTVSEPVDINVDASDNVGVTKVEFYVDGVLLGSDISSPYVASWDTTVLVNGSSHNLSAKAYDLANNTGNSTAVTVIVNNPVSTPTPTPVPTSTPAPISSDTTPPTVSITNLSDGSIVQRNSTINIQVNAADNVKVSKVEFYIGSGSKPKCSDTTSPYTCNWKVSGKAGTTYTITAKAYDPSNNQSSATVKVTSQ